MDPKGDIKATLTPPASEEADKGDDSGSELSDLEFESEENGEILPDHYYDDGKIPVFKPVRLGENCHLSGKLKSGRISAQCINILHVLSTADLT